MGFLKRVTFYFGFILGLVTVALVGTVVITYLFTGKLPSVKKVDEERSEVVLMTPDEVVALVRERLLKTNAAVQVTEIAGGEKDEEA